VCSRDMFNKWEAQRWWGENYDRVVELYNVQTFSRQQGISTPTSSIDDATQVRRRLAVSTAGLAYVFVLSSWIRPVIRLKLLACRETRRSTPAPARRGRAR